MPFQYATESFVWAHEKDAVSRKRLLSTTNPGKKGDERNHFSPKKLCLDHFQLCLLVLRKTEGSGDKMGRESWARVGGGGGWRGIGC